MFCIKRILLGTLFITAPNWKQPRCPPMGKWDNNLWSFHTMEYFSVIKKEQTIATRDYLDESPENYAE